MGHGDKLKQRIIDHLTSYSETEFESYQIAFALKAAKNTINGYLADLEDNSIVVRRRDGYVSYWKINKERMLCRKMIHNLWTLELFGVDLQQE